MTARKMVKSTDKLIQDHFAAQHEQTLLLTDKQKMFVEKHNGEKVTITLLIRWAGMIEHHF